MDSPIQEIKERLNVVDIIAGYLKLQKTGANYRAVCPFHSEKKPSFFVSPTRQLWRCFGCGKSGDVFAFVQEIEGLEFGDALRILAQKAGVQLKRQDPQVETQRKRLYDICELATKFFEKQLHASQTGKKAKEYLFKRGIKEEATKEWRVGFAPSSWEGLLSFLKQKGYSTGEIQRTGLVLESEKGKVYDRFRSRIIFPIFDLNSQPIGFGGRIFGANQEDTVAKYLNIPNTLLYNKSKALYGLHKAKVPIRKQNECVLVEGYTDVIMSHQAGVENVVATSGTALTSAQLEILKRYSDKLITAFDMDIAGDSATKKGIELAEKQGFDIRVASISNGKDPADLIKESPQTWQNTIKQAKSILDFYFESAFLQYDKNTPAGKRDISKTLLPAISRIPNKIEQDHWVRELAKKLEVGEESVRQELKKYNNPILAQKESQEEPESPPKKTRKELIEERIISLALNEPASSDLMEEEAINCFSSGYRQVIAAFKENPQDFNKKLEKLEFSEEIKKTVQALAFRGEVEIQQAEVFDCKQELSACFKELKTLVIKEKLTNISEQIRKAEQEKDSQASEKLAEEFNKLSKTLF